MHINPKTFEMLLQKRGWTQAELARQSGISPKTIGRIKRGEEVRRANAEQISKAFGVSLEVLQNAPTDALISEAAKKGVTERLVLDLNVTTVNDLWLASHHYGLSIKDVVSFAPLLFMIVAERSLNRRRKHLNDWFERINALRNEHPVNGDIRLELDSINDDAHDIYRTEMESIEARELSARIEEPYSTDSKVHRHPFFETIEEIAIPYGVDFIESRVDDVYCRFDGRWAALSEIIPDGHRFPGEAAWLAVEFGHVLLRDVPEELWASNRANDRVNWLASFYDGAKGDLEAARALYEGSSDAEAGDTDAAEDENA